MTDPVVPPLDFSHVRIETPLVSLADVKTRLRIADTAHDAEVSQIFDEAQEFILAKLAYAVDPAWTDATVPRGIRSAILMMTSALYEIRGGEDRDENMRKTLEAIAVLLSNYHDPALA